MSGKFFAAWLNADGYQSIVKTPKGMAYPSFNKWGNLAFSTTAASVALSVAQFETDQAYRDRLIAFAREQTDYALGSQTRSYVVCWGTTPPSQPHHAGASCPENRNLPCGWAQFSSPAPNPVCLTGSLIAGPGGQRVNPVDPDNSFVDIRSDYVTNEPANDYTVGIAAEHEQGATHTLPDPALSSHPARSHGPTRSLAHSLTRYVTRSTGRVRRGLGRTPCPFALRSGPIWGLIHYHHSFVSVHASSWTARRPKTSNPHEKWAGGRTRLCPTRRRSCPVPRRHST